MNLEEAFKFANNRLEQGSIDSGPVIYGFWQGYLAALESVQAGEITLNSTPQIKKNTV